MTIILRIIEILLVLLAVAIILVIIFLVKPDSSPFQQPTFSSNVIPVAMIVAAWTTLLVAYAAFRTIDNSNKLEVQRRVEERHILAYEKIRKWSVETFHALAMPNSSSTFPSWRKEELAKLQHSSVESMSILYFAERVGGDLEKRVIDANFNFQRYLAILMGEETIKQFKERYEVKDDIRPVNNNEEAASLIKELMELLKEVIRSAVMELTPKR